MWGSQVTRVTPSTAEHTCQAILDQFTTLVNENVLLKEWTHLKSSKEFEIPPNARKVNQYRRRPPVLSTVKDMRFSVPC